RSTGGAAVTARSGGVAIEDHLAARHRRTTAAAGRELRVECEWARHRLPRVDDADTSRREGGATAPGKGSRDAALHAGESGVRARAAGDLQSGDPAAVGDGAADGADGEREVDDAAHGDQGDQIAAEEHRDGGGPGGVPAAGDPAGAGEERDRIR